jgi:hypothetical protein
LYDYKDFPEMSQKALEAALDQLKITERDRVAHFENLVGIARLDYWTMLRTAERPSSEWYHKQIDPIKRTTEKLLKLIRQPLGITPFEYLSSATRRTINRRLLRWPGEEHESFEELLQGFIRACELATPEENSGAPRMRHVAETVRCVVSIYQEFSGKRVSLSLSVANGRSGEEFISPGPRFVQLILQGIDPTLTMAEIGTGLRNVLEKAKPTKAKSKDDEFFEEFEDSDESGNEDKGRSVMVDGANEEGDETKDRCDLESGDRPGGVAGTIDECGFGETEPGPPQPDLRVEKGADRTSVTGVRPGCKPRR